MNVPNESTQTHIIEVITPQEFIRRLGIAMSTLHLWKSKGWLMERRHFLKIGKKVLYYWSNELLLELHDNSTCLNHRGRLKPNTLHPILSNKRVDWDY